MPFLKCKRDGYIWLSCVSFSWFRLCTKCIDPSAVSAAMALSWAREDSCDLAISIALSSVNLALFEINFSLTLGEFVPNTIRSRIIFSGSLKSQSWARIRNAVMNFSAVCDDSWTRLWNRPM